MILFYAPDIVSDVYVLNEQESKHAVRVLRLIMDDHIHLTDGKGKLHKAIIVDDNPKKCKVQVINTIHEYGRRNFRIHIAVAPTKNINRFEWFLEKATEIGIDEITPIICEHSERKILKTERLEKILAGAMKQSLKAYKPKLNDPVTYEQFIQEPVTGQAYIAYYNESHQELKSSLRPRIDTTILIGPEGDFSGDELELAKNAGIIPVNLGRSRLRTETAALLACHTVHIINS